VRRKGIPPRAAKIYSPDDLITLPDAITLLAARDLRKHDSDRVRKARMRHHITYAVENRELTETIRHGMKHYVFGRIGAWAQDKWPGKYGDLLAIRDASVGSVTGVLRGLAGRSSGYQIPATLTECQAQLDQALQRIFTLGEELIVAREDADRLRPDAEAWQRQRATNKESAQRPRPRE
jgi:hypothetical protein